MAIINPPAQDHDNLLQEVVGRVSELLPMFASFSTHAESGETVQDTGNPEELLPQTTSQEPLPPGTPGEERIQAARQALLNQRTQRTQIPEEII